MSSLSLYYIVPIAHQMMLPGDNGAAPRARLYSITSPSSSYYYSCYIASLARNSERVSLNAPSLHLLTLTYIYTSRESREGERDGFFLYSLVIRCCWCCYRGRKCLYTYIYFIR